MDLYSVQKRRRWSKRWRWIEIFSLHKKPILVYWAFCNGKKNCHKHWVPLWHCHSHLSKQDWFTFFRSKTYLILSISSKLIHKSTITFSKDETKENTVKQLKKLHSEWTFIWRPNSSEQYQIFSYLTKSEGRSLLCSKPFYLNSVLEYMNNCITVAIVWSFQNSFQSPKMDAISKCPPSLVIMTT